MTASTHNLARKLRFRLGNAWLESLGALPGSPATPKFLILAQGRSGSSLLASLLDTHPRIKCEGEVLSTPLRFPRAFLRGKVLRYGLLGQGWGFKAKHYQITRNQRIADLNAFLSGLQVSGWKLIYLRRVNVVYQALSTLVGEKRRRWLHTAHEDPLEKVSIDPAELAVYIRSRENQTVRELKAVGDLQHLALTYEDDLENPGVQQATCDRIFDLLGITASPVRTDLVRTGSRNIDDVIANPVAVRAELERLGYVHYLG